MFRKIFFLRFKSFNKPQTDFNGKINVLVYFEITQAWLVNPEMNSQNMKTEV